MWKVTTQITAQGFDMKCSLLERFSSFWYFFVGLHLSKISNLSQNQLPLNLRFSPCIPPSTKKHGYKILKFTIRRWLPWHFVYFISVSWLWFVVSCNWFIFIGNCKMSSEMLRRVVWYKFRDVSELLAASIIRAMIVVPYATLTFPKYQKDLCCLFATE